VGLGSGLETCFLGGFLGGFGWCGGGNAGLLCVENLRFPLEDHRIGRVVYETLSDVQIASFVIKGRND